MALLSRQGALRRLVLIALLVLALDQASKLTVRLVLGPELPIEVTGFFNLVTAYNKGVSFSLLTIDEAHGPYVFTALSLLIVGWLVWWLRRNPRPFYALLAGLIVGGALGNVLDRLYLGAVFDFLDFHLGGWHWPAFNLADCGVVLGALGLILDGLFPGLFGRREQGT